MKLINRLMTFVKKDEAQDLIEYALLVGLISLVAVVALTATGTSVNAIFTSIQAKLAAAYIESRRVEQAKEEPRELDTERTQPSSTR